MEIRISMAGGEITELESLDDWLRGERELTGRVKLVSAQPREGQLGALSDALVVAVGSGGAVSVLAASLKAWLSLPRRSDVRIRIHRIDGSSVDIDAKRVGAGQVNVQSLIQQALDYGTAEE